MPEKGTNEADVRMFHGRTCLPKFCDFGTSKGCGIDDRSCVFGTTLRICTSTVELSFAATVDRSSKISDGRTDGG